MTLDCKEIGIRKLGFCVKYYSNSFNLFYILFVQVWRGWVQQLGLFLFWAGIISSTVELDKQRYSVTHKGSEVRDNDESSILLKKLNLAVIYRQISLYIVTYRYISLYIIIYRYISLYIVIFEEFQEITLISLFGGTPVALKSFEQI